MSEETAQAAVANGTAECEQPQNLSLSTLDESLSVHHEFGTAVGAALAASCSQNGVGNSATAAVNTLTASFGPVIEQIIALIKGGVTQLPQLLQQLEPIIETLAPNVKAWLPTVISILLQVVPLLPA